MKDEILRSYVNGFAEDNDLKQTDFDKVFEYFVNYNITSKLYPREFDFSDLSTGGADDLGIDGAAIIVNGNIINSPEEIDFFLSKNGYIKATFALIQSKTSPKFSGEQVGNFIFGIKSLFDDKSSIPENEYVKNLRKIKEKIYKNSISFEVLPDLRLFFVTTGAWKEPEQIVGKVKRELTDLNNRNLFSHEADIEFYDAERLKTTFREISRKTIKEFHFSVSIPLPDLPEDIEVKQALIGSIPVKTYLDIITNSDGKLSKGLFYDNVRDFQGGNKVNKEIEETIRSPIKQSLLPLMNNGVTIISRKVERSSNKIKLTDYQIVNGCQTSHVLFENKTLISEDTNIIIKIIETDDQEVTNQIIRATNRQTEVKDEAFESIKPFHRDLQDYYKAQKPLTDTPIFYERRSKEYFGNSHVKPCQVITLSGQIKSYVSTVLAQPQSTHRYFGELLENNRNKLFVDGSRFQDYFLSSLLVNKIEHLFRCHKIKTIKKDFKYHLAMILYRQFLKLLTKEFKYEDLIKKTNDEKWFADHCKESSDLIRDILGEKNINWRDAVRSREFTNELLKRADV
jgi:hypothetical protein